MDANVGSEGVVDVLRRLDDLASWFFAGDGVRLDDGENRSVLDDSLVEWRAERGLFFGS